MFKHLVFWVSLCFTLPYVSSISNAIPVKKQAAASSRDDQENDEARSAKPLADHYYLAIIQDELDTLHLRHCDDKLEFAVELFCLKLTSMKHQSASEHLIYLDPGTFSAIAEAYTTFETALDNHTRVAVYMRQAFAPRASCPTTLSEVDRELAHFTNIIDIFNTHLLMSQKCIRESALDHCATLAKRIALRDLSDQLSRCRQVAAILDSQLTINLMDGFTGNLDMLRSRLACVQKIHQNFTSTCRVLSFFNEHLKPCGLEIRVSRTLTDCYNLSAEMIKHLSTLISYFEQQQTNTEAYERLRHLNPDEINQSVCAVVLPSDRVTSTSFTLPPVKEAHIQAKIALLHCYDEKVPDAPSEDSSCVQALWLTRAMARSDGYISGNDVQTLNTLFHWVEITRSTKR